MLQVTPQQTILLAIKPVDFRKGIDSLAAVCKAQLGQDPFSGSLYVFTNRQKTSVKILAYDGLGFWLCLRRFSSGKLAWWPTATQSPSHEFLSTHLQILLCQGTPQGAQIPNAWREVKRPSSSPPSPPPGPTHQAVACNSRETIGLGP